MARNPFEQLRDVVVEPRQAFEDIVTLIIKSLLPNSRRVRIYRGDGGIDVYTGTLGEHGEADVYQVKYFPEPWGDSQKQQIRDAYQTAQDGKDYQLGTWTLCVPVRLTKEDLRWFDSWRCKQDRKIELMDGDDLTERLGDERCLSARKKLHEWGVLGVQAGGPRIVATALTNTVNSLFTHRTDTVVYLRLNNEGDRSARNIKVVITHSETACVAQRESDGWIECGGGRLNPRQLRYSHSLNPGEPIIVMGIPLSQSSMLPLTISITVTAEDYRKSTLHCRVSAEQIEKREPVPFEDRT